MPVVVLVVCFVHARLICASQYATLFGASAVYLSCAPQRRSAHPLTARPQSCFACLIHSFLVLAQRLAPPWALHCTARTELLLVLPKHHVNGHGKRKTGDRLCPAVNVAVLSSRHSSRSLYCRCKVDCAPPLAPLSWLPERSARLRIMGSGACEDPIGRCGSCISSMAASIYALVHRFAIQWLRTALITCVAEADADTDGRP